MAHIAVIGIGAMGGGMARCLLKSTSVSLVNGYDRDQTLMKAFHEESVSVGKSATPPSNLRDAVQSADITFLMLVNEHQCEEVCFGGDGSGSDDDQSSNLLKSMKRNSCVVLCSTVSSNWAKTANSIFRSKDIYFVDCPISGGPLRALTGDLTMMPSGDTESLSIAKEFLDIVGADIHIIDGGAGMGSTVKMVHQLLAGVHICCAAEALSLAAKAGIDVHQMYEIVNGAAGASWMFADRGKRMIDANNSEVKSALDIFVKDLGIVHSEARLLQSPIPLASVALQQFISGQSLGYGRQDDSKVVKVYETVTKVEVRTEMTSIKDHSHPLTENQSDKFPQRSVAVIGIGAMGGGMARALLASSKTKFVLGYDRAANLVETFHKDSMAAQKHQSSDPPTTLDTVLNTDVIILMLVNEVQCDEICFGPESSNILNCAKKGSCVMVCSTVTAKWAKKANGIFRSKGIYFVDCPVSGGPARALTGHLTMMPSGDQESLSFTEGLLDDMGKDIHIIKGGAGMGSTAKMVHQLLAGVHICCAAEALALAAKAGVNVEQVYNIVNSAAGASWMFTDRGQRMLNANDKEVKSALDIFVKDLDIVYSEAKELKCPIPIASAALQQFISGSSMGFGKKDDSQVLKVYESITGVSISK